MAELLGEEEEILWYEEKELIEFEEFLLWIWGDWYSEETKL